MLQDAQTRQAVMAGGRVFIYTPAFADGSASLEIRNGDCNEELMYDGYQPFEAFEAVLNAYENAARFVDPDTFQPIYSGDTAVDGPF
ncbi:hypothetical protein [Tumebacillus flagellatus]|uniref:Uncharacterized protein n=1 Tax=Tumebacillus flagellatus TaxID=1157490 RepID=A0A074M4A4_9BACL|nr:hypothetical protein [Tumebacillus flagellatus]KEO80837.1 hypothetical protein EL26_24130 [Tumebacillus flagellatus]